jgi:LuxR family maltose regulon positive regulatory protein
MGRRTPIVRNEALIEESGADGHGVSVTVGSADWFSWLETAAAFAFDSPEGHFTAHKRKHGSGSYWYAYSRTEGRLHTVYLGKSVDLMLERLRAIARVVARKDVSIADAPSEAPAVAVKRQRRTMEHADGSTSGQYLIPTKLAVPRPPSSPFVRNQPIGRLERVMRCSLTVVSAPAGFGKTTLLAQWIRVARLPVAWVSLDKNDNDAVRFWVYVLAALDRLIPGVLAQVRPLLSSLGLQQLPEAALSALAVALAAAPDPTILVLDDYHTVQANNTLIHEALAYLVENLPSQVHIVLVSRADPPLPLARLRVLGTLAELGTSDLRFSSEEVTHFLTQTMGLGLSSDEVAVIDARTEGWVAGLQLAALSLQARKDAASWITTFNGGNRYIFDYLTDEVLEHLAPAQQRFLLETSVLNLLTAPLCDAVTGLGNGQEMLQGLEHANLFLVPLDDQRQWYRYHHLFADVLRLRLQQTQPERVPELYHRASMWCEAHKFWGEAIDYAFAATDFERAAQLVESLAARMLEGGRQATLRRWLDQLPDGVMRMRPHLCVVHAYVLFLIGQLDLFHQSLLAAEESRLRAWRSLPFPERRLLQGEMLALRATAASLQGRLDECIALSQQALPFLPEEHWLRSVVMMNLGIAAWLDGDVLAASQVFEGLKRRSEDQDHMYPHYASATYLVQVRLLQGRLREAVDLGRQMIRQLEEHGLEIEASGIRFGLGMALYQLNDLDAAREHLELGLGRMKVMLARTLGYPALAYVCQAQDDSTAALQWIERALARVEDIGAAARIWLPILQAHQAHLWMAQGNLDAASHWAREYERLAGEGHDSGVRVEHSPPLLREWQRSVLAEVYVAERRVPDALSLLAELLASAEAGGRVAHVLEILVLQATAYAAGEDIDSALEVLSSAIALAEPNGHTRVFLDGGSVVQRLLERLRTSQEPQLTLRADILNRTAAYVGKLLAAFEDEATRRSSLHLPDTSTGSQPVASARQASLRTQPLVAPLSERELEVLRLLASGASNEDLMRELVIAMSTVKRHVSNVLSKLGVRRRTQAIARAYALRLIAPQGMYGPNRTAPEQHNAT